MYRTSVVVAWIALAACGDNLAGDRFTPHSGARLKLHWFAYADGARQPAPSVLTDTALGTTCTVQRWSDGVAYCTPPAGRVMFTDAACATPIYAIAREGAVVDHLIETFTLDGVRRPSHLYRRGPELPAPPAIYDHIGGQCVPSDPGPYAFHERGAEVPRSELVRVKRSDPLGRGRLRVAVDTSDDGLVLPATITDDELGVECVPEPGLVDVPSTRCVPTRLGYEVYYQDDACTRPAVSVRGGPTPPLLAVSVDDATGCTAFAQLGEPLERPALFRRAGDSCIATTPPADERLFARGAPHALATLARELVRVDGPRLWNVELVHEDARLPVGRMFDVELDTECEPVFDGVTVRCLPGSVGARVRRYFEDATCTRPIDIALVPRGDCDPRSRYVRDTTEDGPVVHVLGPPYPWPLYEISTADACLEFVPPARDVPHTLGLWLPTPTFPAATLVVDE